MRSASCEKAARRDRDNFMNNNMLAELASVKPGSYCMGVKRPWWRWWQPVQRGGWLTVDRYQNGNTSVMLTSGKGIHWPFEQWECAQSFVLRPDGELVAYLESALGMWIKWGFGYGDEAELRKALDFAAWAHGRLCSGPLFDGKCSARKERA